MNTLQIRLLSLALFAVFCATLTYWIVVLTAHRAPPPAAAVAPSVSVEDAAALFGGKLTREVNRNIKLVGILALREGAAAIVGVGDDPARAIALGSKITDGTTLAEVHARSIVIDHNGVRSEVPLAPNAGGPTIYVR
ncbi:general secretion pathway protein GspC [Trinickia dabaoshanensis]|uniref:General secretion pathway protein GspC n=1 Tax=Trinickia dabaoshanensis TaxID=564714 RepID=A0A2N7W024_9BURK|nr:general secretion pathway protein GspC [Trinickia dabaoshanensis]PMS22756.1 general secretion pathway protein GspC [Trinickia dabaoshanensis]